MNIILLLSIKRSISSFKTNLMSSNKSNKYCLETQINKFISPNHPNSTSLYKIYFFIFLQLFPY
jgi:hypothetical protein